MQDQRHHGFGLPVMFSEMVGCVDMVLTASWCSAADGLSTGELACWRVGTHLVGSTTFPSSAISLSSSSVVVASVSVFVILGTFVFVVFDGIGVGGFVLVGARGCCRTPRVRPHPSSRGGAKVEVDGGMLCWLPRADELGGVMELRDRWWGAYLPRLVFLYGIGARQGAYCLIWVFSCGIRRFLHETG